MATTLSAITMKLPSLLTIDKKSSEKFLRVKTKPFPFGEKSAKELNELIRTMREVMRRASGVGLSANQIGIPYRFFVAEVPGERGTKFYAVFDPEIVKQSKKTSVLEEGCLSIPGTYGDVERPEEVTLVGYDKAHKKVKIKAWGLLARVFQHEMDHLNGILFIDKAKNIHSINASK